MRRFALFIGLILVIFACSAGGVRGAAVVPASGDSKTAVPDPAGVEFFEKRVRPVLVEQCYKCHSSASEKVKGSLLLDSLPSALQGGETGPAIVPGHPEKSLLIEAVNYTNDDMQMPPKSRLSANVVSDLTRWVQMGAPWPQDINAIVARPANLPNYAADYERLRKEHWAWQPIHDSPVPSVKNSTWPRNDVDAFVLAKLEAKGMKPVADADRATLLRRVTFDLTGLPPTPEETASFLADKSPDGYARRVDRLLESPAFGERFARHWLDIARFGESTGSTRNVPYPNAWRYRDYVIDAFNRDKPYDQFITEQIAGDLIPYGTAQEHNEHLIATGFLAIGVKDLNEKDRAKYIMDNVDEQIDVTTRSIMALTVACARCHDHKFDPIPTADYYAMAGIFKSTDILAGVLGRGKGAAREYDAPELLYHLDGATPVVASTPAPGAGPNASKIAALETRIQTLTTELQKLRQGDKAANAPERKDTRQQLMSAQAELESLRNGTATQSGAMAMGVRDDIRPTDAAICLHGEPRDLGNFVPRGFATVVPVHSISAIDPAHSGRLQLAQWLTSSSNPLTPRVMVNRIWGHLFGEGIVRTVDNFGSTGEAPANPELLDHLASQFMQHGWSVKFIAREMVLSRAYQMSSVMSAADFLADPGDRLTWRMSSRRLDAEEIRDAMLSAGGKLDLSHPRGSVAASLDGGELRNAKIAELSAKSDNRSVYLPILRDLVPPVLDLFDFAEPTMVIGSRDTTTVATQALFLMNDPFVIAQAREMGSRVQKGTGLDDGGRVDLAYKIAFGRGATAAEKARAIRYVSEFQREAAYTTKDSAKASRSDAWASFCQALFGSAEFRYLN